MDTDQYLRSDELYVGDTDEVVGDDVIDGVDFSEEEDDTGDDDTASA
jgi:hypothetical protein